MNNNQYYEFQLLTHRPAMKQSSLPKVKSFSNGKQFQRPKTNTIQFRNDQLQQLDKVRIPKLEQMIKIKNSQGVHDQQLQSNDNLNRAFNSISDFKNREQIVNALKLLNNAQDRVKLIDKILKRRDEIQNAIEILKMQQLNPLFDHFRKKMHFHNQQDDINEINEEKLDPLKSNENFIKKVGEIQAVRFQLMFLEEKKQMPEEQRLSILQNKYKQKDKASIISNILIKEGQKKAHVGEYQIKPDLNKIIKNAQSKVVTHKQNIYSF